MMVLCYIPRPRKRKPLTVEEGTKTQRRCISEKSQTVTRDRRGLEDRSTIPILQKRRPTEQKQINQGDDAAYGLELID